MQKKIEKINGSKSYFTMLILCQTQMQQYDLSCSVKNANLNVLSLPLAATLLVLIDDPRILQNFDNGNYFDQVGGLNLGVQNLHPAVLRDMADINRDGGGQRSSIF